MLAKASIAVMVGCTGLLGQPARQTAAIRGTGAFAVIVDVVVHDSKGNPVTDLTKKDFELLEDGVRQEIGDVSAVGTLSAPQPSEPGAPAARPSSVPASGSAPAVRSAPSFLALVFDQLSAESRLLAYKGALAAVDAMQPGDYVAVYRSDLSLITLQTYTPDRGKLLAALDKVARSASAGFDRAATFDELANRDDHGNLQRADADPDVPVVASAEFIGRPVDGRIDQDYATMIAMLAKFQENSWDTLAVEQHGYATTNSLLAIASALGTLPGRKTIEFFAEGLSIRGPIHQHLMNVIATANRGGVSIYTIDAAGLRVQSAEQATARAVRGLGVGGLYGLSGVFADDVALMNPRIGLATLAEQTGGFLVENMNDLARGVRRIDVDRRFYYLLAYSPKNTNFDGQWRQIRVRVTHRRVAIRARSGYVAVPMPAGSPVLMYEGPALAALNLSPAPADLPLRSAALVFPGGQLAVLAATDSAALQFDRDDKTHTYRTDFTLLARIVDAGGRVRRKASQPYRLSGPVTQIDQARKGEILFFRQPSVPPGHYTLEVALHDALAARASVQRTSFVVPESAPSSLQVSSLVIVQRAERIKPEEQSKGNPLSAGDVLLYPNLGEAVQKARQKTLALYAMIVPTAGDAPAASLEVFRDGVTIARTPVPLGALDASGRIRCLTQFSLEPLSRGNYTLRLTVTQGQIRETRETALQIVP